MPDAPLQPPGLPSTDTSEPEIHVIPTAYYGAALKAQIPETAGKAPTTSGGIVQPPKRHTGLFIGLGVVVLLVGIGGAFIYFNPDLLFPKPAPPKTPVVETPQPQPTPQPTPPTAPTNVVATSTNPQSVAISWVDTAANESGFRLERAEETGTFQSVTNLPPNSTSFLDVSVQSGKTYRYRLIASNQGGDSAPSVEATASVPAPPPPPPEPPKLPPAGLDTDSDGLTDLEEELFKADARNPDSDGDGFLDGNEVFHLYNPNGRAPARLIDAGLVKVVSGSIGWSMQVPVAWNVPAVGEGTNLTIPSGHGETFRLTIDDNPKQLPILEWYLAKNPDVKAGQVLQYRSKQGYEGIIGADLLTTYIPWGDRVFVFSYRLDNQPFINFRTTYAMMLNSLRLQGLPQIGASQSPGPLPFEPAATSTGVITQPEPISVFPTPTESGAPPASTTTEPVATEPPPPPPPPPEPAPTPVPTQ